MRKLKLLLVAAVLTLGGALSANAREDVTSTYLTDAALENEGTNWALVSNGGNHAWNANGYHESWHNTFTITQTTAALPAGYYQLSIQAAVEGGNSTTISLQATSGSNSSVAVYPKYSTYSNYSDMAAWWKADADHTGNKDLNRIFTTVYVEEGQTLTATFKQTANNQWFVYGQMQLHKLNDEEGRNAQILEAVYNPMTNLDMAGGRYKQRFEDYTAGQVTGKKLNKTISGLPKGKYNVTLNGGASFTSGRGWEGNTGDNLTDFYANDANTNVTVVDRGAIGNSEFTDYTASGGLVSDGSLEVGYNNKAVGANWFVGSVKYIELAEPYISYIAEEIPAATETSLTANKWYKFIAASTDDHAFDAGTIGDIVYTTTDGLPSETIGSTVSALMELTEGTTYYIKSTSTQTLTITPQTFTYTVGSATANVSYIQKDNTVTVSYESLGTDNPSPTLVKDFSGVTFDGNTIAVTPTANGFTFTVPAVTAATAYTLVIPANAIGYSDGEGTYNAAQNITLNTPAIFDGTYYLYDETSAKFLSRGKNYGSRAVVDLYGIPFNLTTNANNISTIQFVDWAGVYLFKTGNTIYTDNASTGWKFVKSGDNYYLKTSDDANYTYVTSDNVDPIDAQASATLWTLMSKAERDAIVNAYPTTNKSNVITAASISTTPAEFESYLAANYAAKDKTSLVGTAKFDGDAGDWTFTKTTGGDPAYGTNWTEGFQNSGTWSQTINELAPGIYKVTVNGFERKAGYALCNTLGAEGYEPVTAYFKANDEQLPLKSWFSEKEGTNNPNNTGDAATAFNNDKYKNTIYTYVANGGEGTGSLTLTIGKQDKASGSWVLFNNVTLTYYDSSISPEEEAAILAEAETEMAKPMKASLYQALASAKSAFEGSNTVPNYNALRTAIDNTVTSITSYAAMKTNYLDKIDALLASTNVYSATNAEYIAYVGYKDAYDNYKEVGTADVENATANSLNAYSGDKGTRPVDLLLMPSWTIGGEATGDKFYQNTWSTEGESDDSGFLLPFYEYWTGDANVLNATTLQATQTGLAPNGVYEVSALVRVRQSNAGDMIENAVTMQVGDGTPVDVSAGDKIGESKFYIKEFTATGKADGEGNLTITMSVAENSNINWLAFKNVNYIGVHTASFVNKDWEHVYAYVWNEGKSVEELNGAWPGGEITKSEKIHDSENTYDVYTYTYKDNKKPDYIIFSNGSGTQTDDLPFVDGMMYTNYVTFSPVYAVVGSNWASTDKAIFSAKWDQETTTDILTESAGVWSKTYSGQTLDRDSIAFKVIKKNYLEAPTAAGWYPGSNQKIVMPVKGIYDITITFNGNEGSPVVTGEATKVYEAVTISDKRWATTVTNSPLDFSGVTEFDAYTATVSDSKVVLTKVDDVQAETGLVLKLKDGEDPATFYVPLAVSSSTDKGSLKFSSTLTYNTWHDNGGENNKFYGLYVNGEGKAQFTLINCSAGSEVTIPAQKAFLLLRDGSSLARMEIVYDDETTGISNLNAETGAEGIYNLNGQRVTAPTKGLYIVNGKKVIKK